MPLNVEQLMEASYLVSKLRQIHDLRVELAKFGVTVTVLNDLGRGSDLQYSALDADALARIAQFVDTELWGTAQAAYEALVHMEVDVSGLEPPRAIQPN